MWQGTQLPTIKTCKCCDRSYTAASFRDLPFVGLGGDGEGGCLEYRNCVCGSTLAIEAPRAMIERVKASLCGEVAFR